MRNLHKYVAPCLICGLLAAGDVKADAEDSKPGFDTIQAPDQGTLVETPLYCTELVGKVIIFEANGYRGMLESTTGKNRGLKGYRSFSGRMRFDNGEIDPIAGSCNSSVMRFTRTGPNFVQVYVGEIGRQWDTIVVSGTFTHNGQGAYRWGGNLHEWHSIK